MDTLEQFLKIAIDYTPNNNFKSNPIQFLKSELNRQKAVLLSLTLNKFAYSIMLNILSGYWDIRYIDVIRLRETGSTKFMKTIILDHATLQMNAEIDGYEVKYVKFDGAYLYKNGKFMTSTFKGSDAFAKIKEQDYNLIEIKLDTIMQTKYLGAHKLNLVAIEINSAEKDKDKLNDIINTYDKLIIQKVQQL